MATAGSLPTGSRGTSGSVGRLNAEQRRESIVAAAREVFCEAGLRGARMQTIAERANISKPILYRHFESREQLYKVAIEDRYTQLLQDAAADATRLGSSPDLDRATLIQRLNALYVQLMVDVAPLAAVALYEDHARGKTLYRSVVRPCQQEAAAALYRATTGRPLPEGSEDLVAIGLFGMPFGVALDNLLREREVDVEEVATRISKLFR